jgi:CheY-like chemotaxis protein
VETGKRNLGIPARRILNQERLMVLCVPSTYEGTLQGIPAMGGKVVSMATFSSPRHEPRQVLVVEDEVLIRVIIADELREHGFGVLEAVNADEAFTLLQSQVPVDLLFTDVQLPGSMDGIALANLVRETRPGLKVIIASGRLPAGSYERTADAFFRKPYDLNAVVERIQQLLTAFE